MMKCLLLCALIIGSITSCLQKKNPTSRRSEERGSSRTAVQATSNIRDNAPGTGGELSGRENALGKISAFSLDDLKFSVLAVAVGVQDFMDSQAPVVSLQVPRDADFVEIIRCRSDVTLSTGTDAVSLVDIALSGMSEAEKASFYRRNDFFRGAAEHKDCVLVAESHTKGAFTDSLAPSGSFRYLLRACVNPERMLDRDKVSSRNCSMRVAVSPALEGFVNRRREKELEFLRTAQTHSAQADHIALRLKYLAEEANTVLDYCEQQEHTRKVDKLIRDSWITIASAAIDLTVELKTLDLDQGQTIFKYYTTGFTKKGLGAKAGWANDVLQFIGATEGYLCSQTFILLASQSADVERSCARYKSIMDQSQTALIELATAGISYQHYTVQAALAAAGQQASEVNDGQPQQGTGAP